MRFLPLLLIASSLIAFAFLGYTLKNLKYLGIPATHPRVLVEASLGLLFLVAACFLWV